MNKGFISGDSDEFIKECNNEAKRLKALNKVKTTPEMDAISNIFKEMKKAPSDSIKELNKSLKYNSQLNFKKNLVRQEKTKMENQQIPEEQVELTQAEQPTNVQEISVDNLGDKKLGEKKEKPHLNGQEVEITNVELNPQEVATTKTGKDYRSVSVKVFYDKDNYESYGGFRQYKQTDGSFGDLTIWNESNAAANVLFNKWLTKVGKTREAVSYKEFFTGLVGMKVKLIEVNVMYQGETFHKNIVGEFM